MREGLTQVSFWITKEMKQKLDELCVRNAYSQSALMRNLVWERLLEEAKKK